MRRAGIGIGILALGTMYFLIDPAKGYLPECPFYHFTHLYCPGCGTQRGLHALLHGDVLAALGYNPLMVMGLLFFALEAGIRIFRHRFPGLRSISSRHYTPMWVLVIVLSFWIMRNIPFAPFIALAP